MNFSFITMFALHNIIYQQIVYNSTETDVMYFSICDFVFCLSVCQSGAPTPSVCITLLHCLLWCMTLLWVIKFCTYLVFSLAILLVSFHFLAHHIYVMRYWNSLGCRSVGLSVCKHDNFWREWPILTNEVSKWPEWKNEGQVRYPAL